MSDSGHPLVGRRLRAHRRSLVELPVTILDEDRRSNGFLAFDTRDLSIGGAFLNSSLLFEVGDELMLELCLEPSGSLVRTLGRVVRIQKDPPGMGIEFSSMAEAEREAIRQLVADQLGPEAEES